VGERENEKTPHFSARCDSWCNDDDRGMHIIVKYESSPVNSAVTSTASQNSVAIQNYAFNPSTLTIQKGANVTWTNYDSVQHNVVSDSSAFSSPLLNKGDTYTHQFNDSGSFSYICSIHPYMKGTIVVE
jgi:plastocyanin